MASSFHVFRKNQKLLMALAAIIAIFAFVIADPLMSWLQKSTSGGQGSPTATIVSWDGGSMTGRELETLRQRRYFISTFLQELYTQGARAVINEGGTPLDPSVPNFILQQENSDPRAVMFGTVTTRILAQLATEAGMTVSDQMINFYLREFGLRKVSDPEIAEILKKTSRTDVSYSERQLFAGLRELLLQNYYMRSYDSAIQNVMPEQRWDDWQQINRRIALEAAILPSEKFLAEVPKPTDAEIQELYDQFKDQLGNFQQMDAGVQLTSPDPGFREPRQVRMQFLLGDVNEWTEKLLDTVTDEEISDYYERNKRTQFVKVDLFSDEATSQQEPAVEPETEQPAEQSIEDQPTEEAAEESEPEESDPTEETKTEPAEEDETEPVEEPAEEAESSETESTESTSEESSPDPAAEDSSSNRRISPFRLASLQEEQSEAAPAEEETASPEQSATTEPAEEASTEESDAQDTSETTSEDPPAEPTDESEQAEADSEEEPVEYVPLEEVQDEIRRSLANDKAVLELERVMGRAYTELQSEYNRYGGELIQAKSEGREAPTPPAKLANLSTMAAELGLTGEETALLSYPKLLDTLLGKATDTQTRRIPVAYAAFIKSQMELYEPFLAQDLDGHWYLTVKVEDVESRVPALEEVRDQVISAWNTREAAKLALQRAEELAKEAEESGETLAGFFADKNFEVVTTDLFSRLTFGTTPMEMRRGARLGEAPPLESIDRDFMDEAFDLKAEQVVALLNHDQTNAYVIRLDRREKTEEELQQQFLMEANDWFGGRVMHATRMQLAQRNLLNELTQRVGLDLTELEQYLQPNDEP